MIQEDWRLPTGNDIVSLSSLSGSSGAATDLSILSCKFRGIVEFAGESGAPFFQPLIQINGKKAALAGDKSLEISREEDWIPRFKIKDPNAFELTLRYVAPPAERGFYLEYSLVNLSGKKLNAVLGARGRWSRTVSRAPGPQTLNLARRSQSAESSGRSRLILSAWGTGPEFSICLSGGDELAFLETSVGTDPGAGAKPGPFKPLCLEAGEEKPLNYLAGKKLELEAGESLKTAIFVGFGLEPVSAANACAQMEGRGLEDLNESSARYFSRRRRRAVDPGVERRLNENLLFNYFYSCGQPLDGDKIAGLVSRSTQHEMGGLRRDGEFFFWSFPAILLVDFSRARRLLEDLFLAENPGMGIQGRFLDGAVLEPGFSLSGLCAPVIALAAYLRATGDWALAGDFQVRKVLKQVERRLQSRKHPQISLYESAKGPSGGDEPLGYLAYDNVLVWKTLQDMAEIKDRGARDQEGRDLKEQAEKVRAAIWQHLVADGPRGKMLVWASDLKGKHRFETQPAGCLQLLPYWGFCESGELVFKNTVAYLHGTEFEFNFAGEAFEEIGSAGLPQPQVAAVCNSLLSGRREQARALLDRLDLDGGLACEAFGAKDGKPQGHQADAATAGFLSWALWKAFGKA